MAGGCNGNEEKTVSNRLMTVTEVTEFLGLAVGTVYHMVSQKRLLCPIECAMFALPAFGFR